MTDPFVDLVKRLSVATKVYQEARDTADATKKIADQAMEQLNDAQVEFDMAMGKIRDGAPAGSHWFRAELPKETR